MVNDTQGLLKGLVIIFSALWGAIRKLLGIKTREERMLEGIRQRLLEIHTIQEAQKDEAVELLKNLKRKPPVVVKPSPSAAEIREVVEACYDVEVSSIKAINAPDGTTVVITCPFDLSMMFDTLAEEAQAQRNVVAGLHLTDEDINVKGHRIKLSGLRMEGPDYSVEESSD